MIKGLWNGREGAKKSCCFTLGDIYLCVPILIVEINSINQLTTPTSNAFPSYLEHLVDCHFVYINCLIHKVVPYKQPANEWMCWSIHKERVRLGTEDVILSLKVIHSNLLKVLNTVSSPLQMHAREVDQSYSISCNGTAAIILHRVCSWDSTFCWCCLPLLAVFTLVCN